MTILDQLKRAGAVLVRQKNHQVWRLPNGRRYVMAQTPSDGRAGRNQAAVLKRLMRAKVDSAAMPTRPERGSK